MIFEMAVPALSKKNFIFIVTLINIAKLCCYSGNTQDLPGQTFADALLCFNNEIYNGCYEPYRLTESGNINVPPDATDFFCNGPCLTETQKILNCIDDVLSDFLFYNRATVRDIRYALRAGCSDTSLRGDFNVARYIEEGDTSTGYRLLNLLGKFAFILISMALCQLFL